jgi:FPC/CPF motif-containing protein YcgG
MNEGVELADVELAEPSVELAFRRMSAVLEARSIMNVLVAVLEAMVDNVSEVEAMAAWRSEMFPCAVAKAAFNWPSDRLAVAWTFNSPKAVEEAVAERAAVFKDVEEARACKFAFKAAMDFP